MRILFALATAWLTTLLPSVSAAPSFDCAKMQASSVRVVCANKLLHWPDRQMARLYALALEQVAKPRQAALVDGQRRFLAARDACPDDKPGGSALCIAELYEVRLRELAALVDIHDAYAGFARASPDGVVNARGWIGGLRIARFGDTAAVYLFAFNQHLRRCSFESDNLPQGGKGVLRHRSKPGAEECRIDVVPDGDDMRVEVRGCRFHCEYDARMDGTYKRNR